MPRRLKDMLKASPLFAFNALERDRWVNRQARSLAPGSLVLDIGAGSCPYRALFTHCEYFSQDFCQLKDGQSRLGGYGSIDYVCDVTRIPVQDNSMDAILCTEVLEHLPDPCAAVKEMARMLKPGGKLIVTAPLGAGIHQEPYHYYGGFTPFWYQKFLAEAGFDNVSIEANHGFFKFFSQEALRFLKLSSPSRVTLPVWARLLWAPFWVMLLPFFGGVLPLLCHYLDPLDRERAFTVGFHVTATKKTGGS